MQQRVLGKTDFQVGDVGRAKPALHWDSLSEKLQVSTSDQESNLFLVDNALVLKCSDE